MAGFVNNNRDTAASFTSNPVIEFREQTLKQKSFIDWVLSKGKEEIKKMCKIEV